jgi:hypothetical protein
MVPHKLTVKIKIIEYYTCNRLLNLVIKCLRKRLKFFSLLFYLQFLFVKPTFAYPNFIGHGYNSCITCHYNPFGNGPINDYGRGVSATAISSRGFYSDSKPEDLISQESGFFFKQLQQASIRPFASYRGLFLKRNFGEISETSEYHTHASRCESRRKVWRK